MNKTWITLASVAMVVIAGTASASIVLEDFESATIPSFPSGWNVVLTPAPPIASAWQVGTQTSSSPNVLPDAAGGKNFAFSGRPNDHTTNSPEEAMGTATSPAYIVSYSVLEWLSVGHSGEVDDSLNYFQILNSSLTPIAAGKVGAAQNDNWETASINLLSIGLNAGDTFYFRAVDGRNAGSYAWIGFDNLTLTGEELEIPVGTVPEATSSLIWGLLGLTFAAGGWKRRERR